MIPEERMAEITKRFNKVMSLKKYNVNDLEAGREYIEAYVGFFKFAEGEEENGEHGANCEATAHETDADQKEVSYKVKSGDTLWKIAKANHIANPNLIFPGQKFIIQSK